MKREVQSEVGLLITSFPDYVNRACVQGLVPKKFGASLTPLEGLSARHCSSVGEQQVDLHARQNMFKPRLRISRRAGAARLSSAVPRPAPSSSPFVVPARQQQQQQRSLHASPARRLHEVAPLTDDGRFERAGVPGLFSAESYHIAYTSYQTWALDKLNQMTAGTEPCPLPTVPLASPGCHGSHCRVENRPHLDGELWLFSTSSG